MSKIMRTYYLMRKLYLKKIPVIPRFLSRYIRLVFSAELPPTCDLKNNVDLMHGGLGVVIHDKAVVGSGTKIYKNVTIAGKTDKQDPLKRRYPIIGENCLIGSGAVILGGIDIGNNVNVGANAVVLCDVPDDSTVVGIPGKIVKRKE